VDGVWTPLLAGKRSRPIRAFSATPHDGQRPCRTLAEDPGRTQPRAAYPGAAAQTRVVSMAAIRLGSWESARAFKGIICDDISEFESYMPSHAVGSLWGDGDPKRLAAFCGPRAQRERSNMRRSPQRCALLPCCRGVDHQSQDREGAWPHHSAAPKIVFLALYFLFLWVSWVLAVWMTKPRVVTQSSS
jgi:hypothetical protein